MGRFPVAVFALLTAGGPSALAGAPDLADLFPRETLAYAEVRDPAALARVVGGWVKGTSLEDGLRLVHDRRDAVKDYRGIAGQQSLGIANLLTSPEFLKELARFRGAAVALTGFSDKHEPNAVAVVLFGDSAAGGLIARGFLSANRDLRRIDTIDGVPIFQQRAYPPIAYGNDGKPLPFENRKPTEGRYEATFAYRPGLFVVGTSKPAVADVLKRYGGAGSTPALGSGPAFIKVATDRLKTGVFFYAVPPALGQALEGVRKADPAAISSDTLAILNFVVYPNAFPVLRGNLIFGEDELTLTIRADSNAGQSSPLRAVLGGAGGPIPVAVTAEAAAAVTLSLPPDGDRAKSVLTFADAFAKAEGEIGQPPSELVAGLEKQTGIRIRERVLGKLSSASLVMPAGQELPKRSLPSSLLVLRTGSGDDAGVLADAAPQLARLFTGLDHPADLSSEVIQGVRVLALSGGGFPSGTTIHYARSGASVVIGLERKAVAHLVAGGDKPGLGAASVAGGGEALSGWFRLNSLSLLVGQQARPESERASLPPGGGAVNAPRESALAESSSTALTSAASLLPPVTVRASGKDGLSVEFSLRGFRPKLPVVVDKLAEWVERVGADGNPNDAALPRGLPDR